ncbi:MAG: helix-turn-helix domain-containing protein [Candidatus Nanohaloarchaea archaeon]
MVASQETLDKLEDIGLNMYERKIYSALLGRGISTAGELSEMTNVPRSRAYDVLESLAEKGFVVIKSNKPMEYVSIPPQQAIENMKSQHEDNLEEKLNKLDSMKESEAVNELENLYDQGVELVDPAEMSGSLKGSRQVHQHMGTMFKDAESSIKILTSEQGLNELNEKHGDLLEEAREDGINVKVLSPVTQDNRKAFEELSQHADVRHMDENELSAVPDGRFTIVDNDAATISLTHDDVHSTQDTHLWSKSDHMAEAMLEPMFDNIWDQAPEKPKGPEK